MLPSTLLPAPYISFPVRVRTGTCPSFAPARAYHAIVSPLFSRFDLHFHRFRHSHVSLRAARRSPATSSRRRGRRATTQTNHDKFDYYDDDDNDYDDGDDEYYDDDDDEEEEDEEGGDEEGMMPLEKMRRWLNNKPRGFGEGKVYDTFVEDKLLDEMRHSREAQAANLKKLKSGVVSPKNSEEMKKKEAQVVPIGGRVRLVNLPKKKNIHRDLKSAFEGIPGIVNIVPAVLGNKKTRDPICKGFAFVDFKCEADAVRFIELYSGQSIAFGKIQKPIKCELENVHSSSPSPKPSANLNTAPLLMVSDEEEDSNEGINMENSALSSWDGTTLDDSDADNQIYREGEEWSSGGDPDSATVFKEGYGERVEEDGEEDSGDQDSATALVVDYDDKVEEENEEGSVGDNVAATAFMADYDDSVEEEDEEEEGSSDDQDAVTAFMADYDDSVEEEDEEEEEEGSLDDQDAVTAFMADYDDSVEEDEEESSVEDQDAAPAFMADYDDSVEEEDQEEGSVEDQDAATAFLEDDDSVEMQINSEIGSLLLEKVDRKPTAEPNSSAEVEQANVPKKKQTLKQKGKKKVPKLDVPGSAKRLKIKEKAVLSDVFAKYGSKAATAASKES
ncbi:hypothetical protein PIB30_039249 [Stylosanthes scabra]|uniref:RRM domain-containing protein n=1 Tax=Stylosanthes scabra TaxID=79078 RepID=A0ABU6UEF8_9FABA|nr:hypothetical protein [Stylosanthes scabra]